MILVFSLGYVSLASPNPQINLKSGMGVLAYNPSLLFIQALLLDAVN